jgi:rhomboid protease GluP
MHSEYGSIRAPSKRHAFDWSLVLASQSIESTIVEPSEAPFWQLIVPAGDYEKAVEAIRLFRQENRSTGWNRELPWAKEPFHLGAFAVCWLLALVHAVASTVWPALTGAGAMDTVRVLWGEWWRLFTAVSLHIDLAHLMSNLTLGFVFFGLSMARFGAGWALLAAFLAGALGNVSGIMLYPHPYRGLGASGMVMGALGLLASHSVSLLRRDARSSRLILSGVLAGVFLFTLIGVDPSSDVIGHAGGFVSGLLFGAILSHCTEEFLIKWNRSALLSATGVFLVVWARALLHFPR